MDKDHGMMGLFDMDGTIAGYVQQLIADLEVIKNPNDPPFQNVHGGRVPDWQYRRMSLIKSQPGWWERLPTIESGLVILKLAVYVGFNTSILTKAPNDDDHDLAWTEKRRWCQRHVRPIDDNYHMVTVSEYKGGMYGRFFVDDYPKFMKEWLEHRKRGMGFMPDLPENQHYSDPRCFRYDASITLEDYNNWEKGKADRRISSIHHRLKSCYERKSGESMV